MAFNFLNGVECGLESSGAIGYAWGAQHMKRLIYLWLKKVVGWAEIDIRGEGAWGSVGHWDDPIVSVLVDGATDAANPTLFTSASMTAVASGVIPGDYILVRPTAAPATAGGFSDAKRNGFYQVRTVVDDNNLVVHAWHGVHTDGLPLGESGLTFEIHRLHTSALLPHDDDAFVLEGTGVGGTFHFKVVNDQSVNYGGGLMWEVSPWPDWIPGTHLWGAAPSRHTTAPSMGLGSTEDIAHVYGFADLTQCFIMARSSSYVYTLGQGNGFYVGDIDPFHPTFDTRPVVLCTFYQVSTDDVWPRLQVTSGVQQIGSDDSTYKQARCTHLTERRDSTIELLDSVLRSRSWHSGRWVRVPVLITEEDVGFEEVRGQFKNVWRTHLYGPKFGTPVGAALEWLRFGNLLMPWNGSRQLRYISL